MLGLGLACAFFILARPLERLVLRVIGLFVPRLAYFAARNVARSTERNTLISLMVLLSGVLPTFLATQTAISYADIETDIRLDMGAPAVVRIPWRFTGREAAPQHLLRPSVVSEEVQAVPGIEKAVGLTGDYEAQVRDAVQLREGWLRLVGVSGNLGDVLYEDLMVFAAGGPGALAQILADPTAVVISEGMAQGLAVPLGGSIRVRGEGLDHEEELTVVGVAQRLPGFEDVGRVRSRAMDGGTAFISLEGYRRLTTEPREALPGPNQPVLERVLASLSADADPSVVEAALHQALDRKHDVRIRLMESALKSAQSNQATEQVFLLVLTLLSFVTAVFGVFAVIYVTIYSRRREIGMMKAVGATSRELNGMLSVESIAITSSAALTGILAGTTMAYILRYIENALVERPQRFAVDTTVMPAIVVLVVAASIIGTVFSARRIITRKAVEILRMS
jgi:hypothetical protein